GGGTLEGRGGDGSQGGGVRVHLDQIAAALVHVEWKLRCGVDGCRRADDDHAVRARGLLEAAFEHVGGDRLAERDRVALEQPAATRTPGGQGREVDGVAPEARDAAETADQ